MRGVSCASGTGSAISGGRAAATTSSAMIRFGGLCDFTDVRIEAIGTFGGLVCRPSRRTRSISIEPDRAMLAMYLTPLISVVTAGEAPSASGTKLRSGVSLTSLRMCLALNASRVTGLSLPFFFAAAVAPL